MMISKLSLARQVQCRGLGRLGARCQTSPRGRLRSDCSFSWWTTAVRLRAGLRLPPNLHTSPVQTSTGEMSPQHGSVSCAQSLKAKQPVQSGRRGTSGQPTPSTFDNRTPNRSIYMSALVAVCTRGEDFKRQCRAEGMLDLCLQQAALAVPECALQGAQAAAESTPQLACSTLGDLSSRSVHQLVCLLKAIVSGDDSSATVSKAFDHAREVVGSKVAAVYTLIASCVNSAMAEPAGTGVPPIVKDCVSLLRCLAVNDSICVQFTDDGALQLLTSVAEKYPKHAGTIRNVCGAMKKLAHSDHVKRAVCAGDAKPLGVLLSGLQGFMTDASVVEQALAALSVSVLRTPDNAQMVADRDALPYIAKAMQLHPDAAGLQRQACLCIRNLVSRSKSSLTEPLLEEGVEALLRAAQASHPACLDVAKAALRDLGL